MSLMFRLIAAAHARGTHHYLALDGLEKLQGPNAAAWQRVFLKHAPLLIQGSKAPDDEFKDFQNHVLHPRDNFWGGAPDKARAWYGDLVESLKRGDFEAAAWCAGVLSHYVTDPINPFHTAQSEAENAIHRAFEWSINRSYRALKVIGNADAARAINVGEGDTWLEELISAAASEANEHYEKLIAHYDIHRGVVDPPSGLDAIAQKIIGDLIGKASAVFSVVLERALAESAVAPPDVSLTLESILSALRVPLNAVLKKMENAEERALVERIYDELKATGTVEVNLPEDDRLVRDRYAAEVLAKRAKPDTAGRFPAKGRKVEATEGERLARQKRVGKAGLPQPGAARSMPTTDEHAGPEMPVAEPLRPAPRAADQVVPAGPVARFKGQPAADPATPTPDDSVAVAAVASSSAAATEVPKTDRSDERRMAEMTAGAIAAAASAAAAFPAPRMERAERAPPASIQVATPAASLLSRMTQAGSAGRETAEHETAARAQRTYLSADRDIVDAPSIGPKMADRLIPLGYKTVGDLLIADAAKLAQSLGRSDVDADTVRDWQDQARLVCLVPGVRGTHAQLLVGAGFRTAQSIAECEADDLCTRVLAFAATPAGQRVLRQGEAPDVEKIKSWLTGARMARAA